MFDKRLFSLVPGLGRRIAAKIVCLWVNLLANIMLAYTLVSLIGFLLMAPDKHSPHLNVCVLTGNTCLDLTSLTNAFWPLKGTSLIWQTYWPVSQIVWYLAIFVCIAIIKFLATRMAAAFGTSAAESVKLDLREKLYEKMLRLGPSYRQRVSTADVVQSMGEGVDQIQSFYELFLPQLFYSVLAPITLFCFIAPINMPAAVTLLVCAPLIVIIVGLVAMRASRVFKKYWGTYTDMGAAFLDNMQGLETLKTFDADERTAHDMDDKAETFREMTMKVLQIQLRSLTAMDVVAYGGTAAGIGVAIWQYVSGGHTSLHFNFGSYAFMNGPMLTLAGVLLIILLSADFFIPLRQLGSYFHVAMNGMTSTKRIFALLDAPEPQHGTVNLPAGDLDVRIHVESLAYTYDDADASTDSAEGNGAAEGAAEGVTAKPAALTDVSFDARSHALTAIVGESGSGKSTVASILAGTTLGYDGRVVLKCVEPIADEHIAQSSGKPQQQIAVQLSDLSESALTHAVTLVDARSHLFAGTVRSNLLMAKPDATDDEMLEALRRSYVDDFVTANGGLDMLIEPDGSNLSGGQRQRIAIARALLHDSPVMIFDEATSSVDADSEARIVETMQDLAATKTVIMITHHLANAFKADNIVVLEHGKSVEQGTNDELVALDGLYAHMLATQQRIEHVGHRNEATQTTARVEYGAAPSLPSTFEAHDQADTAATQQTANTNKPALTNSQVMSRLLSEVTPLRGFMALACTFGIIGHVAATLLPVFAIAAMFAITGNPVFGMSAAGCIWAMVVCALVRGFMRYAEQYMNHNVAFRLLALLRHKSFEALRRLAPAKLANKGKGDLIALVTTDIELLEIFFAHTLSPIVIAVTTTVLYAIVLLFVSPWFTLLLIVAHVLIGVVMPALFSKSLNGVGKEIREQFAVLDDLMLDDMRGLGQIIHFGAGKSRLQALTARSRSLWVERERLSEHDGTFGGLTNVVVIVLNVCAAFLTIALSIDNTARIPLYVAAFVLLISSYGPTLALSALPANLTQTFASARRLFALMDEQPAVVETGTLGPAYDGMTMQKITFSYDPTGATPVLQDFSFDVPARGVIGIQGPSGRGKSTMLKLLMRYWDPQAGLVAMSGEPLPNIDAHYRRAVQTMMSQETYLFDGSIRSNLQIAREDATEQEMRDALEKASVLTLIDSLPNGLDTQVGELGGRLSESERQRIGLARMFLRHADLLLFDEPTSRLDSLNEAVILQSMNNLALEKNAAIVLVSHRDSTMRICDKVLRMK